MAQVHHERRLQRSDEYGETGLVRFRKPLTKENCKYKNLFLIDLTQDRGPFWFSYILKEILKYIEIRNEFKV